VFKVGTADEKISELEIWNRALLEVLVCPRCALYMEPYWIRYTSDRATVTGGERDGGDVLLDIVWPYEERDLRLRVLDPDEGALKASSSIERPTGVCHQIGGLPFRVGRGPMICPVCAQAMKFSGIVDYDDESVPLYETPMSPVALIIGDRDCLNFFTCRGCSVVGLTWAH
jgi:hypothetical protein